MNNFTEIANFLWSIADLIRDDFKRGKYQDVILPFTVLRRVDCVLEPIKGQVLETHKKLKGKLDNLDPQLRKASGYAFYNTSKYTFDKLLDDPPHASSNLRQYIYSFSDNMREVIEKFDFDNTITRLNDAGLLFLVMERFKNIDLHPENVSNLQMGYIFEELIRRFNEALNENPGEHFTPREVIRLMVNLILAQDEQALSHNHIVRTVYDPCCGTGGMLTLAQERIKELNPLAEIYLFGQEVNPETYAVCKSDLYIKYPDGTDADQIKFGSTLSNDMHADKRFDYMLANPPYGKDWKRDQAAVVKEYDKGYSGRFGAGTPRVSDGQLLFLQHMLSRMKPESAQGSRVAIVMNGSPLFTGDAGSGESEIRRWIIENDWLEAIVALPEQLFYNTGIATYVWILSNRKSKDRKGKVQLIDATGYWVPMRKSLGDKRREISTEQIQEISHIFQDFKEIVVSKIFGNEDFGFRKVTIERPLRLNFQASPERIARLDEQTAFKNLAVSKKRNPKEKAIEENLGRQQQEALRKVIGRMPQDVYSNRTEFEKALNDALRTAGALEGLPKITTALHSAILNALSERDENADICRDKDGHPEADTSLRDYENVPLKEDIQEYFDREVRPYVPDAWIDEGTRDHKDGELGRVGYEINFNRYFYKYEPPRSLEEINQELKAIEEEIQTMLREMF
jgi:type I restriction enzyme M protein